MPRKELVLDGLWYCLCPSFSLRSLTRRPIALEAGRPTSSNIQPSRFPSNLSSRRYSSNSYPKAQHQHRTHTKSNSHTSESLTLLSDQRITSESNEIRNAERPLPAESPSAEQPRKPPPGVPKTLETKSTSSLEARLQELSADDPRILSATQILRILIRDRQVRPEVRHYRALVLANSDPERGSPDAVREILAEMEDKGIPADSGTLHAALQALAVHPDYLLRQDIIRTLRDRWLTLSPTGWHYLVAGLLREHQFELAIDHIAQMERKDIVVERWLHSLLIYYLCDFQEFDEVVRLMRSRVSQGHDMSLSLWSFVLDVASTAAHHETTSYIWRQMVELRYLHPPREICRKVLSVASRSKDITLATSVVRFLVETDIPLELEDYEVLAETHVKSGDLYTAFEVLCKMHKSGVALEQSTTSTVVKALVGSKSTPRAAWGHLKELKALGYEIPLRCAQVVTELYEHEALYHPFIVGDGVDFYKQLYALCPEKADASVFNSLIRMCMRGRNTDAGLFVVTEMAALGVVPNAATFEHLIVICLGVENAQSAYFYFQDMLAQGCLPSDDLCVQIRELCARLDDEFAVQLRHHPEISGRAQSDKEASSDSTDLKHGRPPKEKSAKA